MKTFYVMYLDLEGDLCHVRVEAFNKEDAARQTRFEYWNVDEIVSVEEYAID
jgi:hypothetical protein